MVGIYTNPNHVVEYSNGEVRQQFSICFRGAYIGGEPRTSDESSAVRCVAENDLDELSIHPSIRSGSATDSSAGASPISVETLRGPVSCARRRVALAPPCPRTA